MAYETKDMTGSIFNNERKQSDNHPDRSGSAKIDGVDYWVNGWLKKDKNGNPYLSLAFKRKDRLPAAKTDGNRVMPKRADMDDTIPFGPEMR